MPTSYCFGKAKLSHKEYSYTRKNTFYSVIGEWCMEPKVEEFCVLDWIELLFLMACFKTIIFYKHISQKTKLK